jgi:hypothetical protein
MSEADTTSAGDLTRSLSGAIQSHPLPAALIGMGLVWLLGGGKSLLNAGGGIDSGGAPKRVSNAGPFASNSRFAAAQSNVAYLMDRQPLVLGAIGLGVGAAMAAALPSTAVEAHLFGQASTDFQSQARDVAGKVTDRAGDLADGVPSAVINEAQAQGLTAENLKQSTSDAGRKVQNIAPSPLNDCAPSPDHAAERLAKVSVRCAQAPESNSPSRRTTATRVRLDRRFLKVSNISVSKTTAQKRKGLAQANPRAAAITFRGANGSRLEL